MDARHATPADAAAVTAIGGGMFASSDFLTRPRTRLLIWAEPGRTPAGFAAFTWSADGGPMVLNGLGPAPLGEKMVRHLLTLSARHGNGEVVAAAPESDSASRSLFTRFPCRTALRRNPTGGEDDIAFTIVGAK